MKQFQRRSSQGTTSEANAPKNKQVREPSDEDESLAFNEDTGTEYRLELIYFYPRRHYW